MTIADITTTIMNECTTKTSEGDSQSKRFYLSPTHRPLDTVRTYRYALLLLLCFYLTTQESLIGNSAWTLPHYTEMGYASSSF